jgi:ATP phosphoribosyltransferase regulatory subunit
VYKRQLDKELDAAAGQSSDVLIFQAGADKQPAQRLARALRQRGYAVARDIISRGLADTLAYAQKMNFRHVLINGEHEGEVRLIRVADGAERRVAFQAVLAPEFVL